MQSNNISVQSNNIRLHIATNNTENVYFNYQLLNHSFIICKNDLTMDNKNKPDRIKRSIPITTNTFLTDYAIT